MYLDSYWLSTTCRKLADSNPCDLCAPGSEFDSIKLPDITSSFIHLLDQAEKDPFPPLKLMSSEGHWLEAVAETQAMGHLRGEGYEGGQLTASPFGEVGLQTPRAMPTLRSQSGPGATEVPWERSWGSEPARMRSTRPPLGSALAGSLPTAIDRRQQLALVSAALHLKKSAWLNTFLVKLQGMCGRCFALDRQMQQHTLTNCSHPNAADSSWMEYKRAFKGQLKPYTFCYNCGVPQDRKGNGEAPECHRCHALHKGEHCPWANMPFRVVWCLWHKHDTREQIKADFRLPDNMQDAEFIEWAKEEAPMEGKYHNSLEVFLWYCETWLISAQVTAV